MKIVFFFFFMMLKESILEENLVDLARILLPLRESCQIQGLEAFSAEMI